MVKMITLKSRDEWLEERKKRIGSSDAAAVLGKSPHMTNAELWEIKTGQAEQKDISNEPYVQYGTEAEKYVRGLFDLSSDYIVKYESNNLWLNDKYPFAHASLDGWLISKDGKWGVWECKTVNVVRSGQMQEWKEGIPPHYYIQCLHHLMVTEFSFCVLTALFRFRDDSLRMQSYMIERNEGDIEYLVQKEKEFYECVKKGKRPNLILNL